MRRKLAAHRKGSQELADRRSLGERLEVAVHEFAEEPAIVWWGRMPDDDRLHCAVVEHDHIIQFRPQPGDRAEHTKDGEGLGHLR
jgi:hypothetical protein